MESDHCPVERDARHLLDTNSCKNVINDRWLKVLKIQAFDCLSWVRRVKCEWQEEKKKKNI